ncbi:pentapeptide repeat-containing protein [Halosimplex sp. TS25]|uniref:pentapeptide repeat-containing protein n=1 Tax=Halosimplex rarum TaxID=3396619 RepID=UPI0039EC9C6E
MPQQGDDLSGRDLSGADFSDANLRHVDLSDADLSDADLSGANLRHADLDGADLSGADLSDANLGHATLVGADLTDATLSGAQMDHAVFEADGDSKAGDLSSAVGSVVVSATLVLGIALLLAGWSNFWIVFVVGFAGVLPVASALSGWYESRATGSDPGERDEQTDALATLRRRYADGEIGDAEFERRVERLLEAESVDDAETVYGESAPEPGPESVSEPASEPGSESTAADPRSERDIE